MPLTRARQSSSQAHEQHDDGSDAIKQRLTRSSSSSSPLPVEVRLPPTLNKVFGSGSRTGSLHRTVSSPAHLLAQSSSSSGGEGSASDSCNTTTTTTPPSTRRGTTFSRSTSFTSRSSRRRRTSSHAADSGSESDDESRAFHGRLGGCNSQIETSDKPDDSNKENVAPIRNVGHAVLSAEALRAQEEATARGNGRSGAGMARSASSSGRLSLTMRRRGSSSSSSVSSFVSATTASTATTSNAAPTTRIMTRRAASQRAAAKSQASSPSSPSSRKRSRDGASCTDSLPATPMSRLRLDNSSQGSNEDEYFPSSSQGSSAVSSVFDDTGSMASSRGTTPGRDTEAIDPEDKATTPPQPEYSNVYAHARTLLRYNAGTGLEEQDSSSSSEVQVVGRDLERKALQAFMAQHFSSFAPPSESLEDLLDGNADSASLYICGLPGTGKTALVRSVLSEVLANNTTSAPPRVAFVNCMAVQHPRQIFVKVLQALGEEVKGASESHIEAEAERRMDKMMASTDAVAERTLIVLDEIDHLLASRAQQNVLYRLFAWASGSSNGCALIGIANSLDLTERFVPLLASKGAAPALLHFRPFESKEITEVLKARLTGLKSRYDGEEEDVHMNEAAQQQQAAPLHLFTPPALELLARKIAAATGDLRKALDAARLSIELVEGEERTQALANCTASGTGTNTEASKLLSHLTPSSAPKVGPKHILKVVTKVLGSPHLAKVRGLGLQAKLMLAALLIAAARAREGMPVLGSKGLKKSGPSGGAGEGEAVKVCDIESTYVSMLRDDGNYSALESSEVLEVFEGLEVQGILSLVTASGEGGTAEASTAAAHASSSGSSSVSPGAKRAARKHLAHASNRLARLLLPSEDVRKGITTVASLLESQQPSSASGEGLPTAAVVESIKRMLVTEEERISKSRGWEEGARQREEVRRAELGGGRGAVM
ncbi:P-loop containing nucleoside triphosphate hydrolase protein [Jaminaea rosea]|uniref:P-loop containing nucleoside triphosphate hydrolase protein n=1 Tax=Jaminaea rosea TaxID=1569628 RepID=A0A316UTQ5_9BASI|nr:P-loop containing nucleoside triphosphate hydrolase protein [Jaminaea rosea]PWN28642.1 P-loop containing nucleoside triphosphate hydrolase protein [Jaminaea rosea]